MPSIAEVARAARPWWTVVLLLGHVRVAHAQECPAVRHDLGAPSPSAAAGGESEGPRLEAVDFVGNRALGDARLARRMWLKPRGAWWRRGADVYSPERWQADHRRLCDLYREHGFVTAAVGPPEVVPLAEGGKAVRLRVPIREGPRFRMGELSLEGTTALPADEARALFDVERGERYSHRAVAEGYERLRRWYGRRGFAGWSATTTLQPHADGGEVDVAIAVDEGPRAFVGRIEFSGHTRTRGSLLRRRVDLAEGELLDTERIHQSVEAIESLGVVHVRDVKLVPHPGPPPVVDVRFEIEERRPLRFGLSGGVGALEGVSLAGTVGTVNALGRGERALVSVQLGTAVESLALTGGAPYVLGSPWTVDVLGRWDRLEVEGVEAAGLPTRVRTDERLEIVGERTLGRRSALSLSYSVARVSLRSDQGPPPPTGFGRRSESRLALSAFADGWDHPWKPVRGVRASGALRLSGGPLGGSTEVAEARGRVFGFVPIRRGALGAGVHLAGLAPFGAADLLVDERYLLGGDWHLRGFDARTVGPLDATARLIGGTRSLVVQAEAHLDLVSWLRGLLFVDAGWTWAERGRGSRPGTGVSAGMELRLPLPLVKLPLRLIAAANVEREPFHPDHAFRIAVGPIP